MVEVLTVRAIVGTSARVRAWVWGESLALSEPPSSPALPLLSSALSLGAAMALNSPSPFSETLDHHEGHTASAWLIRDAIPCLSGSQLMTFPPAPSSGTLKALAERRPCAHCATVTRREPLLSASSPSQPETGTETPQG